MAVDTAAFDEADLNAFADGRLEPDRAAALAESLAGDRQARARIDSWKRQNEGLRTLFASVLFEPVPVRLSPSTLGGRATPPLPERHAPAAEPPRAGLATISIGVALVGFMAGVLATIATNGFGRVDGISHSLDFPAVAGAVSLAERAAETYRAVLADPGPGADPTAGDAARLQHWMTRQLSDAARIPDLRQLGWRFVGGQIVPGRYAPAAFLTYGSGSLRMGLYLARDPVASPARTSTFGQDEITVSAWSEDGLGTAIASNRGAPGPNPEAVRTAVRSQTTHALASP